MYCVGDKVVHPMHGAGVIECIVEEKIDGELMEFYVFKMPLSGLVLKIPTHNCTAIGIRPIRSASEIEEVMCSIPGIDATMTVNWNHRYQENMQRLKTGDLRDVALVIKGLTLRDKERGLSTGERKMLHSAKQVLLSEVVLAQDVAYQDAEARLNSIMSNRE